MLLDKQRDEAHPDWDKSANITFYNGLTDDVKVSHSVVWTLCNPMDYTGQNTGLGSLSLLQGIFPTQGLNPGIPHCRWILYQLSHKGSPRILEWVTYPLPRGPS